MTRPMANRFIALLRGINVGGKHILPMRDLVTVLEQAGCVSVRTYIQSGNVAFNHPTADLTTLRDEIKLAIDKHCGFEVQVFLMFEDRVKEAVAANPFIEGEEDPSKLHLYFLLSPAGNPDFESMNKIRTHTERYELKDDVFYLYAPEGVGSSKLAQKVEKLLGVATTCRNWRTTNKLLDIAARP